MRCVEARARLQDLHDAGGLPGDGLARHLAGCTACAGFREFLDSFGGQARDALDAAAAGMPRPDYRALFSRAAEGRRPVASPARRFRLAFASAAAVIAAGIGIAAGARAWVGHRDRARVVSSVDSFVEELFAEPLLADAGFPVGGQVSEFRDWLEDAPRFESILR
jgi:hypothetical protein